MNTKKERSTSKFLSLVLRHKPEELGLVMEENGWVDVAELLSKMNERTFNISLNDLQYIVENNDKKRFAFNQDGTKIRASQGHSVEIQLDLTPASPPELLYHGTARRNIDSIREKGLIKGQRHHVHLSADMETARKVGMRYGKPIILTVLAGKMQDSGVVFYRSANDVWLTDYVDPKYLEYGNS